VPHYVVVDPNTEWYCDLKFISKPIIAAAIGLLSEYGIGIALWSLGHVHASVGVIVVGLITTGILGGWIWTVRTIRVRRIQSDEEFHHFCHQVRDRVDAIMESKEESACRHLLDGFHSTVVQLVAEFYSCRKGNTAYDSAVRLAARVNDADAYITAARSTGLSASREKTTSPIPAEKGLAKALRDKVCQGVYIVPDIDEAVKEGLWHFTENDKLDDVKAVMVAPINGCEHGAKSMLGMLFVTFPKKGESAFYPADTIPLKAFADHLGLVYPRVISRMEALANGKA
jgi:hypothetical protein